MVATYINDKFASIWKEVAMTYWRYSSDIFLDSLKKTMKKQPAKADFPAKIWNLRIFWDSLS
jgi:hypothetical protein